MASSSNPPILVVGRLSGPKNRVILDWLREALPRTSKEQEGLQVQVLGGPVGEEHRSLEKEFPHISFAGHQADLKPHYEKALLVVGSGRVALEAMALGKPVVALGEKRYLGPLTPETLPQAMASNFGDCSGDESFDWVKAAGDLKRLLADEAFRDQVARTGSKLVREEYDIRKIQPRMEALYRDAVLEKNLCHRHELPVLMYHRVVDRAPERTRFNLHVTVEDLEQQVLWLKSWGFTPVTFLDLLEKKLPKKPIILTFDDGYEDNYLHLFPLLKKHGVKAVVYLLGDRSIRQNDWDIPKGEPAAPLLSDAQAREMAESGLVEFGAHSMTHLKLTEASPEELLRQVSGSRESLGRLLGKPPVSFAYPYGDLNETVKRSVAAAGYTFGIAVGSGPTRFAGDLLEVRRVHMFPTTSRWQYRRKTSGFYLRYRKALGK